MYTQYEMPGPNTTRGKSPSSTANLFNLGKPAASRSPSPAVRPGGSSAGNIFNLRKSEPAAGRAAGESGSHILTGVSQPKSGTIPGARTRARSPILTNASTSESQSDEIVDAGGAAESTDKIEAHNPRMTDAEIKNLLVGYVSLPKKYWHTGLTYRQHIRYIRSKDNIFVRGGFIAGIGKQRGKDTLSLVNCFNSRKPGYYAWVINLDALSAIFIRRPDWDEFKKSLGNNVKK